MKLKLDKQQKRSLILLILITLAGLVLREMCCFYGYPYQMHGDEPTIVQRVYDNLRDKNYMVSAYAWPAQFEIKTLMVLFEIVARVVWHGPAVDIYPQHVSAFYVLARQESVLFGLALIWLSYALMEKVRKGSGLLAAAAIAFYPVMVQHSGYITPDMTLAFFVMATTYVAVCYAEKPTAGKFIGMCVLAGLAITGKYIGALACFPIAASVICVKVKEKKYLQIIVLGIAAIALVLLTCFILMPNLFINYETTIANLQQEARNNHVGADGLSFGGNLWYYLSSFMDLIGREGWPLLILGLFAAIRRRNAASIGLFMGVAYLICTSVLSLHWLRWGIPAYAFLLLFVVLGAMELWDLVKKVNVRVLGPVLRGAAGIYLGLLLVNLVLSGAWIARISIMKDSRIAGLDFCYQNGITEFNCVHDGYTPLEMKGSSTIPMGVAPDGTIMFPVREWRCEYLMVSSAMYNRFYADPVRYWQVVEVYDRIAEEYPLIYESVVFEEKLSPWTVINIYDKIWNFIDCNGKVTGPTIKIYQCYFEEETEAAEQG